VRAGIALAVGYSCIGQPTQLKPNATQIGALTALLMNCQPLKLKSMKFGRMDLMLLEHNCQAWLTQNLSRKIELFNRFLLID